MCEYMILENSNMDKCIYDNSNGLKLLFAIIIICSLIISAISSGVSFLPFFTHTVKMLMVNPVRMAIK